MFFSLSQESNVLIAANSQGTIKVCTLQYLYESSAESHRPAAWESRVWSEALIAAALAEINQPVDTNEHLFWARECSTCCCFELLSLQKGNATRDGKGLGSGDFQTSPHQIKPSFTAAEHEGRAGMRLDSFCVWAELHWPGLALPLSYLQRAEASLCCSQFQHMANVPTKHQRLGKGRSSGVARLSIRSSQALCTDGMNWGKAVLFSLKG